MKYNVLFSGKVLETHQLGSVQAKIQHALKLSDTQLTHVFSGKTVILKKSISHESAIKLANGLKKLGAAATIKLLEAPEPTLNLDPNETFEIEGIKPQERPQLELEKIQITKEEIHPEEEHEEEPDIIEEEPINIPNVCLVVSGVILILMFLPLPDFAIRYGFIIGLILAGIGARNVIADRISFYQ